MSLLTGKRQPIPTDSWLQFDSKNKEFYGIPLHKKDVGQVEYHLVCKDSGGLPASDSLIVQVTQPLKRNFNVEFIMSLEIAYSTFSKSAAMQRKFVEKLVVSNLSINCYNQKLRHFFICRNYLMTKIPAIYE